MFVPIYLYIIQVFASEELSRKFNYKILDGSMELQARCPSLGEWVNIM